MIFLENSGRKMVFKHVFSVHPDFRVLTLTFFA
jgi:hypothetical protein